MRRKILLLSVSAGAGHVRAADAIRSHAIESAHEVEVLHLDVMDYVPSAFRKVYTDFYIRLVNRHPELWGYLYRVTNDAAADGALQNLRRRVERLNTRALRRRIAAFAPDCIVCTHFLPAELLARGLERNGCPVWVQVTDFDLHRLWVQPNITGYFAANEEVAFRMRALGIAPQAISVTGIPVMPAFGRMPDRAACAHAVGLDPQRTTILLMGGGAGVGRLDQAAARLLAADAQFQLIVIAGRNQEALAALQQLKLQHPQRLVAQGYTTQVECLMACADLVVTKPGGLTTSECLALGLPMIVNAPIPGQEERNADFLLEQGVALKASDPVSLEYRVRELLRDSARLCDMRDKAKTLGRPHAARHVLDTVLDNHPA